MVSPEHEPVQLRLIVGRGDRTTFPLDISTKPVSVGTQGDWSVTAEGVGPVHFFLAFDGSHVYVTPASQAHTVLLGGVPLGTGWTVAAVPSELRFAGARVALERAWPDVVPAEGQSMGMSTVSDGGALWDAARRALQDIPVEPEAVKPAAGRPFDGAFDGTQKLAPPPEATRDSGFGSTLTMERNSSPLARRISVPPSGGATMTAVGGPGDAASDLPTTLPGMESRRPSRPPSSEGKPPKRKGAWQEASTVQKIIVVLLPFAIAAAYQMEFHPPRGPRASSAPTGQVGAAGSPATVTSTASTARDVDAPASLTTDAPASLVTAAPASTAPSRPARAVAAAPAKVGGSSSKPQGVRTAERAALDAVAAGAYADAARDYDALAAAHPEDTSFKDAARILHDKATRSR
jgi:hypothetical protein